MATTLLLMAESIQRRKACKWSWHINHFAASLQITVDEANEFIKCIQNGGMGMRKDGTWKANPIPCDTKINLAKKEDNLLNFHCVDLGNKISEGSVFSEPCPAIVECSGRCVQFGSRCNY